MGCGTATLTLLAKCAEPRATVVGLDVDPVMLELAGRKVGRSGLEVSLQLGSAVALPYADGTFDRVLSSLTLHHLTPEQRRFSPASSEAWCASGVPIRTKACRACCFISPAARP